jgi:hypothetical protein
MESSELIAMYGKICATEDASLSSGISKEDACIEPMVSPLVHLTLNGFRDYIFLRHGALISKKCPVHPESTMNVS